MDNKLLKATYRDVVLYITERDLKDVLLNGPEAVAEFPYIDAQMSEWIPGGDWPFEVDDCVKMLNHLCDKAFLTPPAMREASAEDVYMICPGEWMTYGELPEALAQEAHEEGFDEDDDMRYMVFQSMGDMPMTFITSENIMRSDGKPWHGVAGMTNTSATAVIDLQNDIWLVANIG